MASVHHANVYTVSFWYSNTHSVNFSHLKRNAFAFVIVHHNSTCDCVTNQYTVNYFNPHCVLLIFYYIYYQFISHGLFKFVTHRHVQLIAHGLVQLIAYGHIDLQSLGHSQLRWHAQLKSHKHAKLQPH